MVALSAAQHGGLITADLHFAAAGQTIEEKPWLSRGFNGDCSCPKP